MEKMPPLPRPLRIALAVLLALLLAAAATALWYGRDYTLIGGWPVDRDVQELDGRDLTVRGVAGLLRLRAPERLDLRGSPLKLRHYERLREAFPDCEIRWDVPLGRGRYDSASRSLTPGPFSSGEVETFALFPELREVDAVGLDCYEALQALEAARSDLDVRWDIALGSRRFAHDAERVQLAAADADYRELLSRLPFFSALTDLGISGPALSTSEQRALMERWPDVFFHWEVEAVPGVYRPSDAATLDLSGYGGFSLWELHEVLPLFPALEVIDLSGCGFPNQALLDFRDSVDADVRWTFRLCGASVCTTDTEIDLSGHEVADVSVVEDALFYFPHLKKVIMCDCGVSDEEMDALDARHEDIRFVWMVHFGVFYLRTDAETFIATTWPDGYTYLTNEQLWPLQYCRDLIALDLGHMHYSDVSFLWSLHKLQYLILADTNITDISMVSEMPDLHYLEIFMTQVSDITPLVNCQKLAHLNIAYCPIWNADALGEIPSLRRVWAQGIGFSYNGWQNIRKNLPDTVFYRGGGGSTAGGWRDDPAYFEMRDVFGEYYMPG